MKLFTWVEKYILRYKYVAIEGDVFNNEIKNFRYYLTKDATQYTCGNFLSFKQLHYLHIRLVLPMYKFDLINADCKFQNLSLLNPMVYLLYDTFKNVSQAYMQHIELHNNNIKDYLYKDVDTYLNMDNLTMQAFCNKQIAIKCLQIVDSKAQLLQRLKVLILYGYDANKQYFTTQCNTTFTANCLDTNFYLMYNGNMRKLEQEACEMVDKIVINEMGI